MRNISSFLIQHAPLPLCLALSFMRLQIFHHHHYWLHCRRHLNNQNSKQKPSEPWDVGLVLAGTAIPFRWLIVGQCVGLAGFPQGWDTLKHQPSWLNSLSRGRKIHSVLLLLANVGLLYFLSGLGVLLIIYTLKQQVTSKQAANPIVGLLIYIKAWTSCSWINFKQAAITFRLTFCLLAFFLGLFNTFAVLSLREACPSKNGWIFGKVPNGLWPPPLIFGKSCCGFFIRLYSLKNHTCSIFLKIPWYESINMMIPGVKYIVSTSNSGVGWAKD